jgi:hypothetical protein
MIRETEASYVCILLEEIVTRYEETIIDEGTDKKELKEKRLEILYDYHYWNLKLVETEKFYASIKGFEKYIYSIEIIKGKEKVTTKICLSKERKKPNNLFNEFNLIFDVFKEKGNESV